MEPQKCEGWEWDHWASVEDLARIRLAQRDVESNAAGEEGRKLFSPLVNLVEQRIGFRPYEAWANSHDLSE